MAAAADPSRFTCENCGRTFIKGWTDKEAVEKRPTPSAMRSAMIPPSLRGLLAGDGPTATDDAGRVRLLNPRCAIGGCIAPASVAVRIVTITLADGTIVDGEVYIGWCADHDAAGIGDTVRALAASMDEIPSGS